MKLSRQIPNNRHERVFVLVVVALALAIRLLYHVEMRGNVLAEHLQLDEKFHDQWAASIAAGDWIGKGVFFRAPLYPYVLAVVYALFPHGVETMRILQHLVGAAAVVLMYVLGRLLFGFRAGLIAAILGALYAVLVYFEGRLLFDFPVTALALLWLTLALRASNHATAFTFASLGFLFGLICTMRPTFLPVSVPLFGVLLLTEVRDKRLRARVGAALVGSFLLPIALVTARNALVGGEAVVIAAQGGINFYIGNNPQSDGMTSSVPEAGGAAWENRHVEFIAQRDLGRAVSPSDVSRYWYNKAFAFIADRPLAFLLLTVKKIYLFWCRIEIKNNLSFYSFEQASTVLSLLPVGFWLVGPLGIAGMVLAWRRVPRSRLLTVFVVSYMLVTVAFFVCDRFRLPVVPLMCVFSGFALHSLVEMWRTRDRRGLVRSGLLIVVAAVFVNTNFARLRPDVDSGTEQVQALAALQSGRLAQAAELFGRIAALDPENAGARVNQGIALWAMGRLDEAAAAFRSGIGADSYPALLNLAHLFFNLQQMDSASVYAERAIAARPYAPGGYVIAAKTLLVQQNPARARDVLLKGVQECGEDFVYGEYLLAGLLLNEGNLVAADSLYRKVLLRTARTEQPDYMLESERARFGEELATVHGKSLHGVGLIFGMRGQLDSSEVYFRAAARRLPARADILGDWGVCLLRLNRLQEADSVMQRALRLRPDNALMWFNYGTILAHKGDLPFARSAVARALALKPEFPEAQRLFATLNAQLSRTARRPK